jgi:hypothetical protein
MFAGDSHKCRYMNTLSRQEPIPLAIRKSFAPIVTNPQITPKRLGLMMLYCWNSLARLVALP